MLSVTHNRPLHVVSDTQETSLCCQGHTRDLSMLSVTHKRPPYAVSDTQETSPCCRLLSYLNRHSALMPQLTSNEGSLASRLIQARAEMQVTGLPSQTVILPTRYTRWMMYKSNCFNSDSYFSVLNQMRTHCPVRCSLIEILHFHRYEKKPLQWKIIYTTPHNGQHSDNDWLIQNMTALSKLSYVQELHVTCFPYVVA